MTYPERKQQTIVDATKGNCLSACLAMLLGMEVDEVPPFIKDYGVQFYDKAINMWLQHNFGYYLLGIQLMPPDKIKTGDDMRFTDDIPGYSYCIGVGKSPRGDWHHAVVGHMKGPNFEMYYDPHPGQSGLDGPTLKVYFLVPCNPIVGARGKVVEVK